MPINLITFQVQHQHNLREGVAHPRCALLARGHLQQLLAIAFGKKIEPSEVHVHSSTQALLGCGRAHQGQTSIRSTRSQSLLHSGLQET